MVTSKIVEIVFKISIEHFHLTVSLRMIWTAHCQDCPLKLKELFLKGAQK